MTIKCCDGKCRQGRDCPLQTKDNTKYSYIEIIKMLFAKNKKEEKK